MDEKALLSGLLERALHIVLEQPPPDWDVQIQRLDAEIRKVEERMQQEGSGRSNQAAEDLQHEIKSLQSEKHSLEATLFATSAEMHRAKTDLERETNRHRELEGRLQGIEWKVMTVLRKT